MSLVTGATHKVTLHEIAQTYREKLCHHNQPFSAIIAEKETIMDMFFFGVQAKRVSKSKSGHIFESMTSRVIIFCD